MNSKKNLNEKPSLKNSDGEEPYVSRVIAIATAVDKSADEPLPTQAAIADAHNLIAKE